MFISLLLKKTTNRWARNKSRWLHLCWKRTTSHSLLVASCAVKDVGLQQLLTDGACMPTVQGLTSCGHVTRHGVTDLRTCFRHDRTHRWWRKRVAGGRRTSIAAGGSTGEEWGNSANGASTITRRWEDGQASGERAVATHTRNRRGMRAFPRDSNSVSCSANNRWLGRLRCVLRRPPCVWQSISDRHTRRAYRMKRTRLGLN